MNELQTFTHEQFGQVRTVIKYGEPWFVAADVCKALDMANSRDAVGRLDNDEKGVALTDTLGGKQEMTIINEPGLYSLVLGSRKKEAKNFKRWITHDVIPSIRKHGVYAVDEVLANPDVLIGALQALKKEREEKALLQAQNTTQAKLIQEMEPKVSYYDKILQGKSLVSINTIAKDYGMSAVAFNKLLHELKIQYKQGSMWFLYQRYADKGYTQSKTYLVSDTMSKESTYWTQSGRKFLYDKLKENGILPVCERI